MAEFSSAKSPFFFMQFEHNLPSFPNKSCRKWFCYQKYYAKK